MRSYGQKYGALFFDSQCSVVLVKALKQRKINWFLIYLDAWFGVVCAIVSGVGAKRRSMSSAVGSEQRDRVPVSLSTGHQSVSGVVVVVVVVVWQRAGSSVVSVSQAGTTHQFHAD